MPVSVCGMEARTKNKMERDWISAHEDLAFQQGRLDFIKVSSSTADQSKCGGKTTASPGFSGARHVHADVSGRPETGWV